MVKLTSHYSGYSVMTFEDEWDSHTKEIVKQRLGPFPENKFLTPRESQYIAMIAKHIIYDDRENILTWIIHHCDSKLSSNVGEDQRKFGTPCETKVIREGLKALDRTARQTYKKDFGSLEEEEQLKLLQDLSKGQAPQIPDWSKTPQKELFKKLAVTIVSAYYSHPDIWSEIGYAGPAYPRGYIRVELQVTDPWEAKRSGE